MAYTTIDNPELYFQTKLYTGNGSTQSITLDGSEGGNAIFAGNVGINETSVDAKLHISDNTTPNIKFERPGAKKWAMGISGTDFIIDDVNDNLGTHVLKLAADNTATFAGNIDVNGTASDIAFVGGSMNFKDSNNYIRITKASASAQLGLFRSSNNFK